MAKFVLVIDTVATGSEVASVLQVSASDGHRNFRGWKRIMDQLVVGAKQGTLGARTNATATMTITASAVATETFTLNGVIFTARAAATLPNEFTLDATPATQAVNIVNAVNASVSVGVRGLITASSAAGVVTFRASAAGSAGNALTIVEALTAATVSGAVFVGGVTNNPSSIVIGGVSATGTLTITSAAVAAETFTINGVTFTARAASPAANEFILDAVPTRQALNIVTMVNASVTANVANIVKASNVAGVVTFTSLVPGSAGNLFTLTEALTGATVSGANFTGGTETSATFFEV